MIKIKIPLVLLLIVWMIRPAVGQTRGMQEDQWTIDYFNRQISDFKKSEIIDDTNITSKGFIFESPKISIIKGTTILNYSKMQIKILENSCKYLGLFKTGILNGHMFEAFDGDTISITTIENVGYLFKLKNQMRFRFLIFRQQMMNPTVYLLEISNNKNISTNNFDQFIKDAKLTFFAKGWTQI